MGLRERVPALEVDALLRQALLAGWTLPDSRAANADGSVIIGSAVTEDGDRAFVWTECGGSVQLEQRL
ncbi:MAG: hypothetical protein ACKOF7_13360, partial [Phycisphaerales bacterium]